MVVKNFKESREELDIKQKDVAKLFGVHFSTVSGWETGKDTIPIERLVEYVNVYNYSLDYIFGITYRNPTYGLTRANLSSVPSNLKKLRKMHKMSQSELARRLNTTQSTVSYWESGITMIPTAFVGGLIDIFDNFSVDWLFGRKRVD